MRPTLFTEPIVAFLSLYELSMRAVLFRFFATFLSKFESTTYHFSSVEPGMFYVIGLGISVAIYDPEREK